MAVADARCRFLVVDVGAYGRISDGGVLNSSQLGVKMKGGSLNWPEAESLPLAPDLGEIPFFFLGDDAFQFSTQVMKPYSQKLTKMRLIFNYRYET